MTDRHAGYIVVLAADVRGEGKDERIIDALKHVRGVVDVQPIVASPTTHIAESRVRSQVGVQVMDLGLAILRGRAIDREVEA